MLNEPQVVPFLEGSYTLEQALAELEKKVRSCIQNWRKFHYFTELRHPMVALPGGHLHPGAGARRAGE